MLERLRRALPVLVGVGLFVAALEVLRVELRAVTWHELRRDVTGMPPLRLALALALTAANYLVLTGYDLLAFASIGKPLERRRIALTALAAYAVSNNLGFAALTGAGVRYRFYSRWGVTIDELSRIVVSYSVTFWLGLLMLGGLTLVVSPLPRDHGIPAVALAPFVGVILIAAVALYLAAATAGRGALAVGRLEIRLPRPALAWTQLLISASDWALAGAVLYVLLPPSTLTFPTFLGAFLAAVLVGLVSHVPGGVGVFEGLMVILLSPYLDSGQLLPALVAYRAVYFLLPLILALVGILSDELHQRRVQAMRVGVFLGRLTELVTPPLLAVFTFISGLVLLFSNATPAAAGRLGRLELLLPLGVIELSHFTASIAGAVLLVLSQGLSRRLDAAYYLTMATIGVGMIASIAKGLAYEEATWLLGLLLVMWRSRPAFDRRAAFFDTRFSADWMAAVVAAITASVWLGFFAFKHVNYSSELWWQFEVHGEVSRFLRASVGASVVVLLFGVARLLRTAPYDVVAPTDTDVADALRVIEGQVTTAACLALLGDKGLLFNEGRTAFVMYGVQGRTWVALGDPVGPPAAIPELVRLFLEKCDDFGGIPVFYEISADYLHHYADFGLTFVKLGEQARVDLTAFSLEGPTGARYRQAIRRLEKDGGSFRIVAAQDVPAILPRLREVSDDWLAQKAAAEKGFSLGFFSEPYLARFPVAVIERAGHIVAFANLWQAGGKQELSVDLMRYHHDAPKGVMEALFSHLLAWGKAEGYRGFSLGIAPLSGFEGSPVGPLWNRLGAFLYEHGETVYNFQGLRAYKEKFNPEWEPRYLAYPGGLRLPRVLADVAALIAGGYRRIFLK